MKKGLYTTLAVGGLILAAAGLIALKMGAAPDGFLQVLCYVAIGCGCGAFGHGMGELLRYRALKNAPDVQKQLEIERTDERNVAVGNRAKSAAFDAMLYIYAALNLALAMMQADLAVVLLLVFAYLLVVGLSIYYRCKFEKIM